jgi:hypothetical protein
MPALSQLPLERAPALRVLSLRSALIHAKGATLFSPVVNQLVLQRDLLWSAPLRAAKRKRAELSLCRLVLPATRALLVPYPLPQAMPLPLLQEISA